MDIFTKIYDSDGEIREYEYAQVDKFVDCLYHETDKKLKMIYTSASETAVDIQTIPEIQGLTKLYAPVEDLSLNSSDIQRIYEFLES